MALVIGPIPALAARPLALVRPVRIAKAQVDVDVGDVVFLWCPDEGTEGLGVVLGDTPHCRFDRAVALRNYAGQPMRDTTRPRWSVNEIAVIGSWRSESVPSSSDWRLAVARTGTALPPHVSGTRRVSLVSALRSGRGRLSH